MKVDFSKRAVSQLERIDEWWRGHREKAPNLFKQELVAMEEFLARTPNLARVYSVRGGRVVRWVLLPKSKVKLYFWVDDARGVVHIVSAWGGQRGREPTL